LIFSVPTYDQPPLAQKKYAQFRTFSIEGVQTLAQCKADRVLGI